MVSRRAGARVSPAAIAAVAIAVAATLAALLIATPGRHRRPHGGAVSLSSTAAGRLVDPLFGRRLYLDPSGTAVEAERRLVATRRGTAARLLARISSEPVGTWFTGDAQPVEPRAAALTAAAARAGRLPVLVAYDVPRRDCGGYARGGAASSAAYLTWASQLAAGIGRRPAVVILEPDAVAQALDGCLPRAAAQGRLRLLAAALAKLRRDPHASVYLDAGNPGWIANLRDLAGALRTAGIAGAAGFALNVSSFHTTAASIAYGQRLSRLLGGAHFVVDTGRNGHGSDSNPADAPAWCNPPGRALGHDPTTDTGDPLVDAFLWVKPPGESDGACRPGAPAAGRWWPSYALALAANS